MTIKRKQIIAILMILLMVFSLNYGQAMAVDTGTIDDQIVLNAEQINSREPDANQPKEFYTGSAMRGSLTFKGNLPEDEYKDPYIEFEVKDVDAKYIDDFNVVVDKDSEIFEPNLEKASGNSWHLKLKASNAAREAEVPFYFNFTPYITPDKTKAILDISLKNGDGSLIAKANSLEYIGVTKTPTYNMSIKGGYTQNGGKAKDGKLDSNNLLPVYFDYTFSAVQAIPPNKDFITGKFVNNEKGVRTYSSIILTQPLPPYAVFNQKDNPNWTYDKETNTATYELNAKDYDDKQYNAIKLTLYFPDALINKEYIANSNAVFHPYEPAPNEVNPKAERNVRYKFADEVYHGKGNKINKRLKDQLFGTGTVANTKDRLKENIIWEVKVTNEQNETGKITSFKDYELDPRLYYLGISLPDRYEYLFPNDLSFAIPRNVKVMGLLDDGSSVELGNLSSRKRSLSFNKDIAKRIKELSLEFDDDFKLGYKQVLKFDIITNFKDTPVVDTYKNKASYNAIYTNKDDKSYDFDGKTEASFRLVNPKINLNLFKELSEKLDDSAWFGKFRDEPIRYDGEFAVWTLQSSLNDLISGIDKSTVLDSFEIVDLLPEGNTYVKTVLNGNTWGGTKPEVTYKENYQDSGLNAVIFTWQNTKVSRINTYMSNSESLKIFTKVNSDSMPNKNYNHALVKVNGEFVPYSNTSIGAYPYLDTRDIDGDNDTKEKFYAVRAFYDYSSRYELLAKTYIGRETVDNWNSKSLRTGKNTKFRYQLWNYNNKQENISNYEMLAVLPFKGDNNTNIFNDANESLKRNSDFNNILDGPAKIVTANNTKFEIYYTTDDIDSNLKDLSNKLNWTKNVDDYSKVKALKIKLKDGQTYKSGEELKVDLTMRTPEDVKLGDKAYNNFSITSDNGAHFVPTNLVFNEIYIPSSKLTINKLDVNKNPLKGAKFKITKIDTDGRIEEGNDSGTSNYEVITDEKGKAEQVLPLGKYRVEEVEAPSSFVADKAPRNIEIVEDQDVTLDFINIAYVSVHVKKNWQNHKGEALETIPVESVTVKLLKNGEDTGESLSINKANNWEGEFENLKERDSVDGKPNEYSVVEEGTKEETTSAGESVNRVTIDGKKYTVTVDEAEKGNFTITNKAPMPWIDLQPAMTKLNVTKVWKNHLGHVLNEPPIDSIKVELYRDGTKVEGKELTLSKENNWTGSFDNLIERESLSAKKYVYTVKEAGEIKNKVTLNNKTYSVSIENNDNNFTITNKAPMPWVELTPAKKIAAPITISKLEKIGEKDIELAGATLAIYEGDKAEGEPLYKWTSETKPYTASVIKFGQIYTLAEEKAPEGYEQIKPLQFVLESENKLVILTEDNKNVEVDGSKMTVYNDKKSSGTFIPDLPNPDKPVKPEPEKPVAPNPKEPVIPNTNQQVIPNPAKSDGAGQEETEKAPAQKPHNSKVKNPDTGDNGVDVGSYGTVMGLLVALLFTLLRQRNRI